MAMRWSLRLSITAPAGVAPVMRSISSSCCTGMPIALSPPATAATLSDSFILPRRIPVSWLVPLAVAASAATVGSKSIQSVKSTSTAFSSAWPTFIASL